MGSSQERNRRLSRFGRRLNFRLFDSEYRKLRKLLLYSLDSKGFRKYENNSQIIRCAIVRLIREEYESVKDMKGKPKAYGGN